jgi:uncharacterized membrane protein YeaQ/YmgE (transglycosylase-associated protein family)
MAILSWIIFGLVAGAIAKLCMPGRDPGGFIWTILLGIAGAMLGGFVGTVLGFGDVSGFNMRSLLLAIAGAMLLLFAYRATRRRPA